MADDKGKAQAEAEAKAKADAEAKAQAEAADKAPHMQADYVGPLTGTQAQARHRKFGRPMTKPADLPETKGAK